MQPLKLFRIALWVAVAATLALFWTGSLWLSLWFGLLLGLWLLLRRSGSGRSVWSVVKGRHPAGNAFDDAERLAEKALRALSSPRRS